MMTEDSPSTEKPRGRPPGHSGARKREDSILAALEQHPEGLTRNALAQSLGEPTMKVWLALDRLRNRGLVRTCAPVPVVSEVEGRTVRQGRQVIWSLGEQCPE